MEYFCSKKINILVITSEIYLKMSLFIQYSRFYVSHFPTSQPTTAFYSKLGCIQFSLPKLGMLTPVHNDANNTDNADNPDNYNRVIGTAQLKVFNCAKNRSIGPVLIWPNNTTVVNVIFQETLVLTKL